MACVQNDAGSRPLLISFCFALERSVESIGASKVSRDSVSTGASGDSGPFVPGGM